MEMKYYNPSNNFRAPIPREPKPYTPPKPMGERVVPVKAEEIREDVQIPAETKKTAMREERQQTVKAKKELNQDDLLILGLIFLLVINSCDDYLLLAVLGFLFLSGWKDR